MIKEIKIATILPYKENYTISKAAAASVRFSSFTLFRTEGGACADNIT